MDQENQDKKIDESWKNKAKSESLEESPDGQDRFMHEPNLVFFLTSLGMQAYVALGLVANPVTNKTEKNLDQAKYIIDTLAMLEEKTNGNRDKDETEILQHLLHELRLAFVHETTPPSPTP